MSHPLAVTLPVAVRLSGCSRSALYRAISAGQLEARKAGRRTLILTDALEAFLARLPTVEPKN
jgi:excisionase family DNA binding protein